MLEYWLWLAHRPGINEHTKVLLLQYFKSPQGVYTAEDQELADFPSLNAAGRKALADKALKLYETVVQRCLRDNIRILTYLDQEYPRRLRNIYNPPLVLYCKGTLPKFDGYPTIGVVGTRRCTAYGISIAERLGGEISCCGGTVVSGLASGIDAAAMRGALRLGYPTVGVLGTGVDVVYPAQNRALFAQVEQCGCILSEFLPGTGGIKRNFPKRNRIISGLSVAVVVVEAPEKSGALYTARAALDESRDVYVVPGNVDMATFAGSNRLLREGANPISCGWDVMSEYRSIFPDKIRKVECPQPQQNGAAQGRQERDNPGKKQEPKPASGKKVVDNRPGETYIDLKTTAQGLCQEDQAIVNCLTGGEKLVDDVIAATGISTGILLRHLTMLELRGIVVRLPGNRIKLRKS